MQAPDAELARLAADSERERDHQGAAAVARRHAVFTMWADERLHGSADQFAAATVLVHGELAAEVGAAQQLALAAMANEPRARLLAAVAYDRLRRLAGTAQKFGTQVVQRDGRAELWPVDPATTDSERAKWGVPPLAELRARLGRV